MLPKGIPPVHRKQFDLKNVMDEVLIPLDNIVVKKSACKMVSVCESGPNHLTVAEKRILELVPQGTVRKGEGPAEMSLRQAKTYLITSQVGVY